MAHKRHPILPKPKSRGWQLIKRSSPGWVKEFTSKFALRQELLRHICSTCLDGEITYIGANSEFVTERFGRVPNRRKWQHLLGTGCGCEYEVRRN